MPGMTDAPLLTLIADTDPVALADDPHTDMIADAARKNALYRSHRKHYRSLHPIRALADFEEDAQ